jgi:6-pyruvoyltetrahydropterin/6-carboxytetrahydropterin synthase
MYELLIQSHFAAAHRLREYTGNCERLHGHNWRIDVVLRAPKLDRLGMVIDFRDAKRLIEDILDGLDHQYLNELDAFRELNPTTENIARTIFDALAAKLPPEIALTKVTAWESDLCGASYIAEPQEPML